MEKYIPQWLLLQMPWLGWVENGKKIRQEQSTETRATQMPLMYSCGGQPRRYPRSRMASFNYGKQAHIYVFRNSRPNRRPGGADVLHAGIDSEGRGLVARATVDKCLSLSGKSPRSFVCFSLVYLRGLGGTRTARKRCCVSPLW